jgi:hypothetical protein
MNLPAGFQLDTPEQAPSGLPSGFVLEQAQQPSATPQSAKETSLPQELARQVGLTGRAAYTALTAPATAALEFGKGVYNIGANLLGSESRIPSFAEKQSQLLSNVGVPEPKNAQERAVQAATEAMASTGGLAKLAPQVPALASNLVQQIPAAAAGAGVSQAASEQVAPRVKEITGSDVAASLASLGLGAIAAGATGKVAGNIAAEAPKLSTMQEVKQRASKAYNAMDEAGVMLKPKSALDMVDNIKTKLDEARMVPGTDQAKEVNARLNEINNMIGTERVSFTKLDKMRSMLNDLKGSSDKDVQRLGRVAVEQVDNYIANLTGKDIMAGKEGLDKAVSSVMAARKDWRNASRAEILNDALDVASAKALDNKASESELIRRGFINIAANKDKMNLFNRNEQNIIKSVAKGGSLDPLLTFASRFNPERPGIAMIGTAGIAAGNPALAGTIAGGGYAADKLQAALRRSAAEKAAKQIASGVQVNPQPNYGWRGLFQGALKTPQGQ